MTKDAIIQFICQYLPIAMRQIEESREQGHLVYEIDLIKQVGSVKELSEKLQCSEDKVAQGRTTASALTQIEQVGKWGQTLSLNNSYQLAQNYTPAQALESILSSGVTTIDCITAINIAWYLCIKALLCHHHGNEKGIALFNQLFNRKDHPFIITHYDIDSHVGTASSFSFFITVPVLGYFIKKIRDNAANFTTVASDPLVAIGTRVNIFNDPNYLKKHRIKFNHGGAITLMCVGKDRYMGFGLGSQALTEAQVMAYLQKEYDQQPLEQEKTWLAQFIPTGIRSAGTPTTKGYMSDTSAMFDWDKLYTLIHNFPQTVTHITRHIATYQAYQCLHFRQNYTYSGFNKFSEINLTILEETIEKLLIALRYEVKLELIINLKTKLAYSHLELAALANGFGQFIIAQHNLEKAIVIFTELNMTADVAQCRSHLQQMRLKMASSAVAIPQLSSKAANSILDKDNVAQCLNLLKSITQKEFLWSKKEKMFWVRTAATEVEAIINLLTQHSIMFDVTAKKVVDSPDYVISVQPFNLQKIMTTEPIPTSNTNAQFRLNQA